MSQGTRIIWKRLCCEPKSMEQTYLTEGWMAAGWKDKVGRRNSKVTTPRLVPKVEV